MWVWFLILLIVFEAIADIFSKQYALTGTARMWLLAIVGYIVANVFWLYAIRNGSGLARGAVLFSIGSAVLGVFIGYVLYKEPVSQLEMAGIAIGILSITLISLAEVVG